MSLFLCLVSQPGTSALKREVPFLGAVQVPKAEPKLLHELLVCPALARGGRIGISWFKELADPSLLASRTLYVTALLLSGGGFKADSIPGYLTRLPFQSL